MASSTRLPPHLARATSSPFAPLASRVLVPPPTRPSDINIVEPALQPAELSVERRRRKEEGKIDYDVLLCHLQ